MSQNTRSVQAIERVVRLELEETEKHLIGIVCSSFEIDDVMASRWGSLEVFKFLCYLSIPAGTTYFIAGKPEVLEAIIKNRSYVVYPPEGKRPPSAEELSDIVEKQNKKRQQ